MIFFLCTYIGHMKFNDLLKILQWLCILSEIKFLRDKVCTSLEPPNEPSSCWWYILLITSRTT